MSGTENSQQGKNMKGFSNIARLRLASGFISLLLIGCGSPTLSDASEKPTPSKKSTTPVKAKKVTNFNDDQAAPTILPEGLQTMDKQEQSLFARAELAKRLGVPMEKTKVSGAIRVTWKSGALGCPEPGTSYTQALVPGMLIMVKVGNKAYRYHASSNGAPFYCPDARAESQYLNSSDI